MICGHNSSKCIDSRVVEKGRRRRYKCTYCNIRWTTMEVVIPDAKNGKGNKMINQLEELYTLSSKQKKAIEDITKAFPI